MPTIEETIDDIILRLDENAVIVGGIRHDTDTALTTANLAVTNIADVRVNVRGYTDQRIQEVYDFFANTLETWAESILETAGAYSDSVGSNVGTGISNDLDSWKTDVQNTINDILADYASLTAWAESSYDIEIPAIVQSISELTEELRQAEQDILNEVGTSRQEIAEMASRWRELASQIQDNRNAILEMDYSIYEVKDEIYRGISAEFDGRFANFDEKIVVAAGLAGAVADRVTTLEVEYGEQTAMVQNLERAMIDGDEQLALQISALSVGNNTQFDPARIWHFNDDAEGWTGDWTNGYLDVHGPVQSGTVNINASQYRQVRARIQKVGVPTWDGYLNWTGATPAGPESIPEPSWAGDFGEFTVNIPWNGTLTGISLTLGISTEPDPVNNYYRVDWVSVGRPSPGASTADVLSERLARVTADSALALRIDNLEANYTTSSGFIDAVTNIIDGVRSEITDDAVTGAVTALNEQLTLMDTSISNLQTGQTANTSAISALTNRVTLSEDELVAVNSRIDNFEINIDDVINSQAYQGLVQRVNVAEGDITTINSDITTLNTNVSTASGNASTAQALAQNAANLAGSKGKVFVQNSAPPVSERLPQNLWIDTTGDANTPKRWNSTNNAWEAVTDKVARDAAAAAAAALAGLGDKADSSALSALSNRVTINEDTIEAQAQNLVSLTSNISIVSGDASAAQQAAQNAMTTAQGKGQVLYQSAAPNAQFRLPQNLWIDTTNNNNTPKRWNGTAWVSVTDKVALDAAAAAAAAMNAVATKADASAVSQLTTRVAQTETGIDNIGQDITTLNNSITIVNTNVSNLDTKIGTTNNTAIAMSLPSTMEGQLRYWRRTSSGEPYVNSGNSLTYFSYLNENGIDIVRVLPRPDVTPLFSQGVITAKSGHIIRIKVKYRYNDDNYSTLTPRISLLTSAYTYTRLRNGPLLPIPTTLGEWVTHEARITVPAVNANESWLRAGVVKSGSTPNHSIDIEFIEITDVTALSAAEDAQNTANNALNQLTTKADASAVTSLNNKVTQLEGDLTSQSTQITSLNNSISVTNGNVDAVNQAAQNALDAAGLKGEVIFSNAAPPITKRLAQNLWIDTTGGNNTPKRWNGSAWVAVTDKVALDAAAAAAAAMNAIATKADASAVSELSTRVTQTEGGLTSLGQDITRIDNSISVVGDSVVDAQTAAQNAMTAAGSKGEVIYGNSAPPAAKRLAQNLWIDTNGDNNTPKRWNGTAWVAVTDKIARDAATAAAQAQASVATKAEASTVNALTQTVNQQGNTLTSTTNRVSTVENRINNTNTGLSALSQRIESTNTRVTQVGNIVTAQGDSISALNSSVGNFSAGGLFRVRTVATPTGALSRIAIVATASSGEGNTRSAGLYLEAIAGNRTRLLVEADRFAVVQNAVDGEPSVPFFIQNGVTYIKAAYIPNLAVDTLKIANNAVSTLITKTTAATLSIVPSQGSNWITIQNITINKLRSDALPIILSARFNIPNTNQASWVYGRVRVGSTIIWQDAMSTNLNWLSDDNFMLFNETIVDTATATGNRNYIWEATCYGGSTMPVLNRTMIGIVLLK